MDYLTADESYTLGVKLGRIYEVVSGALVRGGQSMPKGIEMRLATNPLSMFSGLIQQSYRVSITKAEDSVIGYYVGTLDVTRMDARPNASAIHQGFIYGRNNVHEVPAAQAARMLSVSRVAVSKMIETKRLDAIKTHDGHVFVTQRSIDKIEHVRHS